MAFDQNTRNRLQRFVADARSLLADEFTRQLQATYGMNPKTGEVADTSSLSGLTPSQQETAHLLRDTLAHYLANAEKGKEKARKAAAIERIVREQAFTVLNRLAALRMSEARGFLIESLAKGYDSKGFLWFHRISGASLGETGDAYRHYLFSLFDEFSLDLSVLFDRFSVQGRLFPSTPALLKLLALINAEGIAPLWAEDETIGWIYQYFNSSEERKKMREHVCVMIEKEKRLQVPLHHLNAFVLFDTMMSPALMGRCAADGRSIIWLNRTGKFMARLEGPVNGNILLRQAQYRTADDVELSLKIAQRFIAGKIRNSRQVLMRGARDSKSEQEKTALVQAARLLAGNLSKLAYAQSADTVRGLEGDSARVYFAALPLLIRPSAREDFAFTTRNRRPPLDCFNALISFLYALILGDCRSALETVGLDPQLGFLHSVRPGRASLALDLLEEFRACICDRLAITLINLKTAVEHIPANKNQHKLDKENWVM